MSIPLQSQRSRLTPDAVAIVSLLIIFLWVYGRFAFGLYFGMDDFIHAGLEMTGPLWPTLRDAFSGSISWSGYRPLSTAMRIMLFHAFGLERMWGYYIVYLTLHLINTLLSYRLVRRVASSAQWAFIAAAIVLLLPAHNEAVFWFAANANVLALFFCLLALDFALTAMEDLRKGPQILAALAYTCAVLAYEVTFALPLLILLADWIRNRRGVRTRLRMYILFVIAALALIVVRLLAQGGTLVPDRSDYAASLELGHFVHGYLLLFSQILLLYNSPYSGAPLFAYTRTWLEPTTWLAIVTIALTLLLSVATFVATARADRSTASTATANRRGTAWLWIAWGSLWMLAMGFAFASLTGRNPENRYTYLLSFGFAVSLTVLVGLVHRLLHRVRALQFSLLGAMAGLLAFYAFVSVGDAIDWTHAGGLVRSAQASISAAIPSLGPDQAIGQIGIPAHVGGAYTYTIEGAFQNAMHLLYGQGLPGFADNASLRTWFLDNPTVAKRTYAFTWDGASQSVVPIVAVILCKTYDNCQYFELRRPDGASKNRGLRYVQIYDTDNPHMGGVGLFASLQPYAVKGCYVFQDFNVQTDSLAFIDYPQAKRCNDAVSAFWDYSE